MKKRLIILFLIIANSLNLFAAEVTGKVIDAGTKQPIDFANVSILKADGEGTNGESLVTGTITDEKGNFTLDIKDGEYTLVWCEPVCRNKKTDKYIRSYFFENDGTTLDVVYYKGNTTFKNKISLTGQTIRHLK